MINCPTCGHDKTTVARSNERAGYYERRRVCENCGKGFITREYSSHAIKQILNESNEQALDVALKLFGGRK